MTAARAELIAELVDRVLAAEALLEGQGQQIAAKQKQGAPGRGIDSVHINENGDLIIRYSDGSTQNAGRVRGADGKTRVLSMGGGGGGGGVSRAEVIQLIEAGMSPTPEIEYPRLVTTVTAAGPNTLLTPEEGKAIRVRRIKCTADPDTVDTPMLTLSVGAKLIQRGPVLYGSDFLEGAVDAPLVLDLESAAKVAVNIDYEEFTP